MLTKLGEAGPIARPNFRFAAGQGSVREQRGRAEVIDLSEFGGRNHPCPMSLDERVEQAQFGLHAIVLGPAALESIHVDLVVQTMGRRLDPAVILDPVRDEEVADPALAENRGK